MSKPETDKPATNAATMTAPELQISTLAAQTKAIEAPVGDDGRTEYRVTAAAGSKVAGQRVTAGMKIRLTEAEAIGERATGAVTPWNKDSKPA